MNILLVEPGYKSLYPPLALMRISTMHKQRGDNVDFYKEGETNYFGHKNPRLKDKYDVICITSLFTYHYAEVVDCYPNKQIVYAICLLGKPI